MRTVKCISKFKGKNGRVYLYRIMDANAEMEDIHPYYLKQEIKKGKTYVINLTIEDISHKQGYDSTAVDFKFSS